MASIPHARFPDAFRQARGGGLATAFAPLMISLDDGVTREALMAHAERVYQARSLSIELHQERLLQPRARFPLSEHVPSLCRAELTLLGLGLTLTLHTRDI